METALATIMQVLQKLLYILLIVSQEYWHTKQKQKLINAYSQFTKEFP